MTRRHRAPAIATALALLCHAYPGAAGTAKDGGGAASAIDASVAQLKKARSSIEAGPALKALADAGAAGFPALQKLATDPALHPEVRFYAIDFALRNPAPGAVDLAAQFLESTDRDLRFKAVRTLEQRAEPRTLASLLAQIPRESDPRLLGVELHALGRCGPKGEAMLRKHLEKGAPALVLSGAALGLGLLHRPENAERILDILDDSTEDWLAQSLFEGARQSLGSWPTDKLVATASDPRSPLRIFALEELQRLDLRPLDAEALNRRARAAEAARSALADPTAFTRKYALLTLAAATATPFQYVVDPAALTALMAMTKDPSPKVRLAAVEALGLTAMRRTLIAPGMPSQSVPAEAVRLMRWPSDWTLLPGLIGRLEDPDADVRQAATRLLAYATGYSHGFRNKSLEGDPQVSADVKSAYREIWEQLSTRSAAEYTNWKVDNVVLAMTHNEQTELHADWMAGIKLLSGRDFGWNAYAPPEERAEAVSRLKAWWAKNSAKHPAEWIVDSLREEGFRTVSDYHLNILGRWAKTGLPASSFNPVLRQKEPAKAVQGILEWWEASKTDLLSASLSR